MSLPLNTLIQQRTGGADNVRGVRYQILYTLLRALRAHANGKSWSVSPEGLEDVDVEVEGIMEHVQVKFTQNHWTPHMLKKALTSIIEAAHACKGDPAHTFSVLLAGDVSHRVQMLADRDELSAEARAPHDAKLEKLLRKAGANELLARTLSHALTLHVSEPGALDSNLQRAVVDAFDAHPESAHLVIQALAAFVLDHAQRRKSFSASELKRAYAAIAQGQEVASSFEAYGRQLIGLVDWTKSESPSDFVDGRGTRPSHIASELDVERPQWIKCIDEVLSVTRLCIIRAPSGQGKSALAFRFARDQWEPEATFLLKACSTPEDAAQISAYLRARADLGLPTSLIIDGADWRLQHWPTVAAAARDRGIPVLVTVRVEDWHRFAAGSAVDLGASPDADVDDDNPIGPLTDAAIVEPRLDLDEARALFWRLRDHGRIHEAVRSPEDAYEQIGEPALLMEYVYLLTHGELLRHRLRGQIRVLQQQRDDAHLAVLRLASFAHACGVPAPSAALLDGRPEDPQRVLSQVDGEYVRVQDDDLVELHRIRSEHLASLLHEGGPSPTGTARRLLPLLSDDRLGSFVAGAFQYHDIDRNALRSAIADLAVERGPATTAVLADGLFESGERDYFEVVSPLYDEAEAVMGSAGPFFLSMLLAPNPDPGIFDDLIRTADKLPNKAGKRFRKLQAIASEAPKAERGYDRIRSLLADVLPQFSPDVLLAAPGPSGRLLQDAHRLNLRFPSADLLLNRLAPPKPDGAPDFAALLLGLYVYAPDQTERWVRLHADPLGHAVAEHLTLVGPPALSTGPEGPAVDIAFYPSDMDGAPSLNDQAVSRLRLIRELYPFAVHFRSRAHWFLPTFLRPTLDESIKDTIPKYLRPRLFRARQGLWNVLSKELTASPTFWAYQEAWYELRTVAVNFAEAVEKAIRAEVEGRTFDLQETLSHNNLEKRLHSAVQSIPKPPIHISKEIKDTLKGAKDWATSLQNVIDQITQFDRSQSEDIGRVLCRNAYKIASEVGSLHDAFDALFEKSPDSFDLRDLRDRERRTYGELAGAIEFWTDPPVRTRVRSLRKTLREFHNRRDDALRARVQDALARAGVYPSLHPIVIRERLNQTVVLALPVEHPCDFEPAVLADALSAIADLGQTTETEGRPGEVWIALTAGGHRFQTEAFQFYSHQLDRLAKDGNLNWESFVPRTPPSAVAEVLEKTPARVIPVYEAWKAAHTANLFGVHIEEYLMVDSKEHPRAIDHLSELIDRAKREVNGLAARLRAVSEPNSVPAFASIQLDRVAQSFARGEVPTDDLNNLMLNLKSYATAQYELG